MINISIVNSTDHKFDQQIKRKINLLKVRSKVKSTAQKLDQQIKKIEIKLLMLLHLITNITFCLSVDQTAKKEKMIKTLTTVSSNLKYKFVSKDILTCTNNGAKK